MISSDFYSAVLHVARIGEMLVVDVADMYEYRLPATRTLQVFAAGIVAGPGVVGLTMVPGQPSRRYIPQTRAR